MYSLLIILALHFVPFVTSFWDEDNMWQSYVITLLAIVAMQSFYIYRNTKKKDILNLLAFILLVIGIWHFFDYISLSVMG